MDKEDLFKLLDLKGKEAIPQEATERAITSTHPGAPSRAASLTALVLDGWALRRGREVLAESERLQALPMDEYAIADFHGAAFEPDPQLHEDCVDQQRHQFLQQLLETPDYQALHAVTLLNEAAAAIATTAFAEQFAALKDEPAGFTGQQRSARRCCALSQSAEQCHAASHLRVGGPLPEIGPVEAETQDPAWSG